MPATVIAQIGGPFHDNIDPSQRCSDNQYTLGHYEHDFADRHSLHGVIAKWAAEKPQALAIIDADSQKQYTYQQFDQITSALALKLLKLGFRKGDFLATSLPFLPEHVFLEYACAVGENDGAQVIDTTGSTGLPKPALLSHRNITVQNMCLGGAFGIMDNARMLVNLPPSHVGGQAEQLMTPFFWGGTVVLLHIFDAEKSLRAIQDHRVNCFGQIPALFALGRNGGRHHGQRRLRHAGHTPVDPQTVAGRRHGRH